MLANATDSCATLSPWLQIRDSRWNLWSSRGGQNGRSHGSVTLDKWRPRRERDSPFEVEELQDVKQVSRPRAARRHAGPSHHTGGARHLELVGETNLLGPGARFGAVLRLASNAQDRPARLQLLWLQVLRRLFGFRMSSRAIVGGRPFPRTVQAPFRLDEHG